MNINFTKEVPKPAFKSLVRQNRGSLFELVILLVVGILFYWFILSPKIGEVAAAREQASALKRELAKLEEQKNKLDSLVRQLDSNAKDLVKLDEALPLHPRTTWTYLLIENLAQSSGMTLSSLSVTNASSGVVAGDDSLMADKFAPTRTLQKTSANMGLTGTFAQFQAFLKKIENSSRIMDIKILEIGSSEDQLLDFRLAFDAYYYAP